MTLPPDPKLIVTEGDHPALDAADGDWWLRTHLEVDAPVWLEFAGLTFPAEVFVDGAAVAECESMFLPVRVPLDPGRHEVVVRFGSLPRWLAVRRPRGRWRSSLTAAQGLRWARTTLLGHAPVYGDVPIPVGCWRPVRVVPAGAAPAGCTRAGEVEVSVQHSVGFYERNPLKVRDELETLARNKAPGVPANTLQPLGEPADGTQNFAAWNCPR